jgi:hypothetical protein
MPGTVALRVAAAVLIAILAGGCGSKESSAPEARAAGDLAVSAAAAVSVAPGVRYSLSIVTVPPLGGIDSDGVIDFESGRFSGTADAGVAGGTMLMFGGPTHGALILADGLFVQTEAGPWERQPDQDTALDRMIDRAGLSQALARAFAASPIDPAVREAPCGGETCQVVGLAPPPAALRSLAMYLFGDSVSEMPRDLAPTAVDLYLDASGFPVRMETRLKAGTTVTTVTLQLTRLDPAPVIAPPIP